MRLITRCAIPVVLVALLAAALVHQLRVNAHDAGITACRTVHDSNLALADFLKKTITVSHSSTKDASLRFVVTLRKNDDKVFDQCKRSIP